MTKAIGIYREFKLAGKPGKDQKILDLTGQELRKRGFEVLLKEPKDFSEQESPDLIFTMARGEEINEILIEKQRQGVFVINSPEAIRFSFNRKLIYQKMTEAGANLPRTKAVKVENINFSDLKGKSILKPSDRHEFWSIIDNEDAFEKAIQDYKSQNIKEVIVQKFIKGRHIKYYVIGEEVILPKNTEREIPSEVIQKIKKQALLVGRITRLKIFGGDFIVEGEVPFCVDVNDWPSMASIEGFNQEEAAFKTANLIEREYVHRKF